jgi:hypothetical protein
MRFATHYTRDEARALLPKVRKWLKRLVELRDELEKHEKRLASLKEPGRDLGGEVVNSWIKALVEIKTLLLEFHRRDIQIKDLDKGLIDFPAMIGDKEVFLCWEQEEDDIEFWHELDAGYAGRERLSGGEL